MNKIYILLVALVSTFVLNAQVFESFSFNGALNANGWTTHSGATPGQFQTLNSASDCQNSLYYSGLEISSGNRITYVAGNTEDVNKAITGISGTGYYSFLLNVSNTTGLSATGDYFTGFGATSGASVTVFAPRVFIKAGVTPNTFQLGIQNTTGGTPNATYSGEYSIGTTVFVVVKLTASTAPIQASIYVNAVPGAPEPTATVTNSSGTNAFANFTSIFLRQGGTATSGTGNLQMDEIRVGSTWASVTPACAQILSWYPDADGDSFGGASPSIQSCCQPTGYVSNNTDCDDSNAALNPNAVWYADTDGDGFGDINSTQNSCTQPQGYVTNSTDCNDNNSQVNALSTFYLDADNDGFGNPNTSIQNCGQPNGYVSNNTDCDDSNASLNPNQSEIADNVDNDCDGLTDEGFTVLTWYLDNDQDGFGGIDSLLSILSPGSNYTLTGGDCNDSLISVNPNAQEICDNLDNNCDGLIDNGLTFTTYYADNDSDNYGDATDSIVACSPPTGYVLNNTDCNDANPAINPGATDIPLNGIDEDCNGVDAPLLPVNLGMYLFTGTVDCTTQDNAASNTNTDLTFSIFNGVGTNCSAAGGVFNRSGWNTTTVVDLNQYNEFSVNAADCKVMNLDRVAFKFRPSGSAGSPVWHLRSSLDNFASDLDFGTGVNVNNVYLDDTVFLTNHTNLSQVTFRFYITEMLGTTTTWRMDDVSMFGNVISLTPQTYYADSDGDGFGYLNVDTLSCTMPLGFVSDSTDCDDLDSLVNPATIWYMDLDGDLLGDSSTAYTGCIVPMGYVLTPGDCDDLNPQILGPVTYYLDTDGDGFGVDSTAQVLCQNPGLGFVTLGGDCNDTDSLINPSAIEICDGIDNDCDGNIDNGLIFVTYYADADGDGFGIGNGQSLCQNPGNGFVTIGGDCDDLDDQIYPGALEICDGIDNDCDGNIDDGLNFVTYYTDADNDGYGAGNGQSLCQNPGNGFALVNGDCDDSNASINPNATEILDNTIDENCDGVDGYVGFEELDELMVSISPNPNDGEFILQLNENVNNGEVRIIDLNGKRINSYSFSGDKIQIVESKLQKGVYLIHLVINGNTLIERIIIQ